MSFTNNLETDVLTYFFTDATAPARPASWFLGLHLAGNAPGETGISVTNELSGNAYARQSIGSMTVSGDNASNGAAIEFPTATGTWGEVAYVSIWLKSAAGTSGDAMLAYAALASNKTVSTGDVLRIPIGDLDINME